MLRNSNYLLGYQGTVPSDFWQVSVPAPVPTPVLAPYLDQNKMFSIFFFNLAFLMLIEAALLPRNLSSHLFWFHFITVLVPLGQKVTVSTFPVPQHSKNLSDSFNQSKGLKNGKGRCNWMHYGVGSDSPGASGAEVVPQQRPLVGQAGRSCLISSWKNAFQPLCKISQASVCVIERLMHVVPIPPPIPLREGRQVDIIWTRKLPPTSPLG